MIIKPTVGRKIWYTPRAGDLNPVKLGDQPFDATIVFVHDDNYVNLAVQDHAGNHHTMLMVRLLQEGEAPDPEGGNAYWMPYETGQAAKTEAAEKAVTKAAPKKKAAKK